MSVVSICPGAEGRAHLRLPVRLLLCRHPQLFEYTQVYQEEFGTVRGHFGPVNAVAFHPDGRR